MLRVDAEMRWLSREVIPTLRELEDRANIDAHVAGTAIAYLEVLWIEAQQRAGETESALEAAARALDDGDDELYSKARRFHEAVMTLRKAVARRIAPQLDGSGTGGPADESGAGATPDRCDPEELLERDVASGNARVGDAGVLLDGRATGEEAAAGAA